MPLTLRLSPAVLEALVCPVCRSRLDLADHGLTCTNTKCHRHYPVVDGIPIVLNEESSIFSIEDFVLRHSTTIALKPNRLKLTLSTYLPNINLNVRAGQDLRRFASALTAGGQDRARVLVVGGRILGEGMEALASNPAIELVESDVSFGPRTMLIADAHDIPFQDGFFDGVVAQAMLEHVVDPYRCVDEIHRVLKDKGLVYAETPFMQQVHAGRYDFTRFTHLGHRRLFRRFEEIDSGAVRGPGMALAWAYQYFLLSFARHRPIRLLITAFARLTAFYLKYFDYLLIGTPGALDAASSYSFTGRKSDVVLSDRELIRLYAGAEVIDASEGSGKP